MYHYYTRDLKHIRYPKIKGLAIDLFRKQIAFFKANFNAIRLLIIFASGDEESQDLSLVLCEPANIQ